jgi:hypothetical protein
MIRQKLYNCGEVSKTRKTEQLFLSFHVKRLQIDKTYQEESCFSGQNQVVTILALALGRGSRMVNMFRFTIHD